MANEEQLAILKQGVRAWNAWREAHPDVRPDLSGADLARANLARANLAGADLVLANLEGADLVLANLEGANLYGANLVLANLAWANLERANLRGAILVRADLTGANLYRADLTGANLYRANLAEANLARADLAEANLVLANLRGANLAEANLVLANLRGANLAEANLEGANLEGANLRGANLAEANLEGANLEGANLEDARLFAERDKPGDLQERQGSLSIPLETRVPAGEFGLLLHALAELYATAGEEGGTCEAHALIAQRISVGTPNEVELIGMLPQITAIAAALVAVLKVPKALGEGAEKFAAAADKLAAARKTWIEGTLLKQKIGEKAEPQKRVPEANVTRIEVAFNHLAQAKDVISGEPRLRIVGAEAQEHNEQRSDEEMPKRA